MLVYELYCERSFASDIYTCKSMHTHGLELPTHLVKEHFLARQIKVGEASSHHRKLPQLSHDAACTPDKSTGTAIQYAVLSSIPAERQEVHQLAVQLLSRCNSWLCMHGLMKSTAAAHAATTRLQAPVKFLHHKLATEDLAAEEVVIGITVAGACNHRHVACQWYQTTRRGACCSRALCNPIKSRT